MVSPPNFGASKLKPRKILNNSLLRSLASSCSSLSNITHHPLRMSEKSGDKVQTSGVQLRGFCLELVPFFGQFLRNYGSFYCVQIGRGTRQKFGANTLEMLPKKTGPQRTPFHHIPKGR